MNYVFRAKVLAAALMLASTIACTAADQKPVPKATVDAPMATSKGQQTAVLAGGCFWGMQAVFQRVKGVISATSGYSGGAAGTAEYELVSNGDTGHAESVKITYDASQITYGQLLQVFFSVAHDPTELNYQGPDHGTQYRSAIFPANAQQRGVATAYIAQLHNAHVFSGPIVTRVEDFKGFYPAENYHQNFLALHPDYPYIAINDLPKVSGLKRMFPELYRNDPVLLKTGA